jgi:3-oxoacyl-[acyl-carrier-protein] synthase II
MEFDGRAMRSALAITPSAPAITGLGLVTALGQSAGATWDSLLAGNSIADHARVPGLENSDRALALALACARAALEHAKWPEANLNDPETALIVGTSKGPIESWLRGPAPELTSGLSQTAGTLSSALGFGIGPRLTYSAACASGLHALIRAAMMLQCGEARRALVVAVEASVHPLFIASFERLGVLAPAAFGCRPFDRSRRGFLMSEAAAAICLERSDDANGRAIVNVDRFAWGGDGVHLVAGDPTGANLKRLLKNVIDGREVDLVHAHGTGTIINDPVELAALKSTIISSANAPWIYSHKGALGHSLGASGLVSVVLNCLMHGRGQIPANIRTRDPLPVERLRIHQEIVETRIQRSLVIATGFGGPTAVVSLISP